MRFFAIVLLSVASCNRHEPPRPQVQAQPKADDPIAKQSVRAIIEAVLHDFPADLKEARPNALEPIRTEKALDWIAKNAVGRKVEFVARVRVRVEAEGHGKYKASVSGANAGENRGIVFGLFRPGIVFADDPRFPDDPTAGGGVFHREVSMIRGLDEKQVEEVAAMDGKVVKVSGKLLLSGFDRTYLFSGVINDKWKLTN